MQRLFFCGMVLYEIWAERGGDVAASRTPGEGICPVFLRRLQNVKNP